jgi:hypothetical protein
MSVIAAPRRTNSIALSWHWKQTFGNRFPLVVSSDLLSRRLCGRTKLRELNDAISTPAAECSLFEIGRIPERRRATTSEFPLLDVSGHDACKIIEEQGRFSNIREGPLKRKSRPQRGGLLIPLRQRAVWLRGLTTTGTDIR